MKVSKHSKQNSDRRLYNKDTVVVVLSLTIPSQNRRVQSIEHLKDIVKYIVEEETYNPVTSVDYVIEQIGNVLVVSYIPNYRGEPIYTNRNTLNVILNNYPLVRFYGFRYITSNPLIYHTIDTYHKKIKPIPMENIYIINGMVFIHGDDELVNDLAAMTTRAYQNGYFNVSRKGLERKHIDIVRAAAYLELCVMFNCKMVSYCNPAIVKSQLQFYGMYKPDTWFEYASTEVIRGNIPFFILEVPSVSIEVYKQRYTELSKSYPFLKGLVSDIKIIYRTGDTTILKLRIGGIIQARMYYRMLLDPNIVIVTGDKVPTPNGSFNIIRRNNITGAKSLGLILNNHDLIPIPYRHNYLNTHQMPIIMYSRYLPYRNMIIKSVKGEVKTIDKLNKEWKEGNLMSGWGKSVLMRTGKISRFSFSPSK